MLEAWPQARKDLQEMNIRSDLHPEKKANDKYYLPPALYNMSKEEKKQFCKVLHDIKVPDGYSSNISRCVNVAQAKITGLKSHDCHILMQQLLPVASRGLLPDGVTSVLFDLCGYFRELNAKVLYIDGLEKVRGANYNDIMSNGDDIPTWIFYYDGSSSSSLSN